jgi:hypothetical protein
MRIPRMTTRRLMVLVAVVALTIWTMGTCWNIMVCYYLATYYESYERTDGEMLVSLRKHQRECRGLACPLWKLSCYVCRKSNCEPPPPCREELRQCVVQTEFHVRMGATFRRAMWRPWLPVPPDPPEPK